METAETAETKSIVGAISWGRPARRVGSVRSRGVQRVSCWWPEFLDETLTLLRDEPDAKELVVERAKFVREVEASGTYDDVLALLSSR
ncbi:hypothetical protein [Streptomyces sp. NPDC046862]|uniref:hypothetical protein n=1 Tax=Streptomyces sp. NPDC046862 TaxID=3154603 RepID=UPI0034519C7F